STHLHLFPYTTLFRSSLRPHERRLVRGHRRAVRDNLRGGGRVSFNVIVIPEDDRLDSYILTPVLKAALAWVGKRRATVRMVSKPRPRGIDTMLTTAFFDQVRRRYGMADLFLYCIDRDGSPNNDARLRTAVQNAAQRLRATQRVDG